MLKLYLSACGVFLVYDITNKKSFENLRNFIQIVNEYTKNIKKIIIGNKSDLEEKSIYFSLQLQYINFSF